MRRRTKSRPTRQLGSRAITSYWSCSPAPGFASDIRLAHAVKERNPNIRIAFVGPHVTVLPEKSLEDCPTVDFVCRKEFDYSVVELAHGRPPEAVLGISYRKNGVAVHNPDPPPIENLDTLPHITDVYKRDLDITATMSHFYGTLTFLFTQRVVVRHNARFACGRRL
jgi:hypothetical protein